MGMAPLWALSCWAGVAASAPVPVVLPQGERPEDWVEPLALAGLEPGPPGDGPWIIVAVGEGRWWMVVRPPTGDVVRTEVRPPTSAADREELAFLGASLLRTVAPTPPAPPEEPPSAPTVEAKVYRAPAPPPSPPAEPTAEPSPPAPHISPTPAHAELAWSVHVGAARGLGVESTVVAGASAAAWSRTGPGLGLHIDLAPAADLLGDAPEEARLSRWDVGVFAGAPGPAHSWWGVGVTASRRTLESDSVEAVHTVIPRARAQLVVPLQRTPGPAIGLLVPAGIDLRATEVRTQTPEAQRLPPWSAGLALTLTHTAPSPWSTR